MNKIYWFTLISVLFSSIFYACNNTTPKTEPEEYGEEIVLQDSNYLYNICVDSLCVQQGQVKRNETLSKILGDFGISQKMIHEIVKRSDTIINVKKINAGKVYTAILSSDSLARLNYLVYQENDVDFVVFNLKDTVVYRESKPLKTHTRIVKAKIDGSLWETLRKLNTSPLLTMKLSEIYESQIDFFEIMPTDSFSVMFDESFVDDSILVNIGPIHAAVFNHRGKDNYAFAFCQDSKLGYYDEKGDNLKRAFLKAPLNYSRISSKFTNSRYHPVLKIYRAHHGVDYAAPKGTPVYAIGAGTVSKKGYQAAGGGNYVTIKHPNGYKSTYMHLHGFAKGIKEGQRVDQGELIGYVGSTGLSTGPHLDFRIYKNDKPVNPLTVVSPPLEPLHENMRDSFEIVKNQRVKEMNIIFKTEK